MPKQVATGYIVPRGYSPGLKFGGMALHTNPSRPHTSRVVAGSTAAPGLPAAAVPTGGRIQEGRREYSLARVSGSGGRAREGVQEEGYSRAVTAAVQVSATGMGTSTAPSIRSIPPCYSYLYYA